MSREIKFRAWSKTDNTMGEPFDLFEELTTYNEQISAWLKDTIFLQYTGLKDKNGVEIYEGDLYTMPPHDEQSVLYPVKWGHSGFGLPDNQYIEVIGNIYENPELLNKED